MPSGPAMAPADDPGGTRLAIDYGRYAVVAVLAWPDGRWTPLWFDGSPVLSTAVHVGAGTEPLVGAAAWAAAARIRWGLSTPH
jgi:hypothetical protein